MFTPDRRFWEESFDRLDAYLHELQAKGDYLEIRQVFEAEDFASGR